MSALLDRVGTAESNDQSPLESKRHKQANPSDEMQMVSRKIRSHWVPPRQCRCNHRRFVLGMSLAQQRVNSGAEAMASP